MKIEWLNDDLTEARVTRGVLWWKRAAHVKRHPMHYWNYANSGAPCPDLMMEARRDPALANKAASVDWQPVRSLPEAKVVKR